MPRVPELVVRTLAVELVGDGASALIDLLPGAAPLAWVREGEGIVGWGEAARIEARGETRFADAEQWWVAVAAKADVHDEVNLPGTGLAAFGSFSFDPESAAGGVLIVPQMIVGRQGGRAWVTTIDAAESGASFTGNAGSRFGDSVRFAQNEVAAPSSPGAVTETGGAISADRWQAAVRAAIERIYSGALDKVVLAREVVVEAERPIDSRWPLRRLAVEYPATWTFSVDGLIGATPELLVRMEDGRAFSRVLAGTIRRDAALARLLESPKELQEHRLAVESVTAALAPFCAELSAPEQPAVLSLPNVTHLATDVTGTLRPGTAPTSLALAAALHPTAAVCGTPTLVALGLIREVETLDRGRYAGPIGWLGANGDGEWGIALRCAQLDPANPRRARLYAGCGIMAASDPDAELTESEAKLAPMRSALASIREYR
ncbi:MAG: chorismate-binding protein [Promicromonosporaceae bacterium]|nr:chorismate-binding protein [Promicromonosporaceae bacterium]